MILTYLVSATLSAVGHHAGIHVIETQVDYCSAARDYSTCYNHIQINVERR
jgi:hypothetical protein